MYVDYRIYKRLIIELGIGVMLFISSFGQSTDEQNENTTQTVERREEEVVKTSNYPHIVKNDIGSYETKAIVEEYFSDIPVMTDIAYCESRYRQHDANGNVMRGIVNSSDVGVMQINTYYHGDAAVRLGLDLHDLNDNMAYGRYLYESQGVQPWSSSAPCWNANQLFALR